ncbi:MAG: FixH family protein [Elusimicrobiota bacterium]|nr:FixH family protein [Elusimicrobiota bacterium]
MKKLLLMPCLIVLCGFLSSASAEILKEKKQYNIDDNYSFTYQFPKKPKMGTAVLKISVFNKEGKKVKDLDIFGSYDMPSMRGHHATGPDKIKTNKKNEYLMPVDFVMPGDWEIILTFQKDGQNIYTGEISVNI